MRLFVGLELSPTVQNRLQLMHGGIEDARWTGEGQHHLTLAFIGEVPGNTMREIESALAGIHFTPFDMELKGVGMFGTAKRQQILWASVADETPVGHLRDKVAAVLDHIDVETDRRRYKPHVTLARFKRGIQVQLKDWLAANSLFATAPERVEHFSLFSSQLSKDGAHYRVEARFAASSGAAECLAEDSMFEPVLPQMPEAE